MGNSTIARAARAEKIAEGDRKAAETHWRKAWWKTALTLAGPDDSDKKEIGQMYDEAEAILGQSRRYLSERRRVGQRFATAGSNEIETLEPEKTRIAVTEVMDKVWHGTVEEMIVILRESEENEESKREFRARFTGVVSSEKRETETSDEEIEKALEAKPELAAKVAANAIKTETGRKVVAQAMVEDDEAMTEVKRAEVEAYTRTSGAKSAAQTAKQKAAEEERERKEMFASGALRLSSLLPLVMASKEVQEFLDTAEKVDYRADDETKDALRKFAERFRNFATVLNEIADGAVSTTITDEDLEALLGAS